MQEIEEQFGFPVYSVVDVYDIIEYLEEAPANEENVTRIKTYLAVNGAKYYEKPHFDFGFFPR